MASSKQGADQTDAAKVEPVAPGTVVAPGSIPPEPVAPASAVPSEPTPENPQEPSKSPEPEPKEPAEALADVPTGLMDQGEAEISSSSSAQGISWTASEFVAHEKSSSWYFLLAVGTVAASVLMYVVTRDYISVAVVVVAALLFGVYGAHQPRQLQYHVDQHGVGVGSKNYNYDEFRSFSVIPEGAFSSIVFMPLKRFAPALTIYYDPKDEDKILDLLSRQLPFEQKRRDAVDSLMRRIRF